MSQEEPRKWEKHFRNTVDKKSSKPEEAIKWESDKDGDYDTLRARGKADSVCEWGKKLNKRKWAGEVLTLSWQWIILIAKVMRGRKYESCISGSLCSVCVFEDRRLMRGEQDREMPWPLTSHPKTCKTTQHSPEWHHMSRDSSKNRLRGTQGL